MIFSKSEKHALFSLDNIQIMRISNIGFILNSSSIFEQFLKADFSPKTSAFKSSGQNLNFNARTNPLRAMATRTYIVRLKKVTVMLMTPLCWSLYGGDRFEILVSESLCWRRFSLYW